MRQDSWLRFIIGGGHFYDVTLLTKGHAVKGVGVVYIGFIKILAMSLAKTLCRGGLDIKISSLNGMSVTN